jgi:hypothetical protein
MSDETAGIDPYETVLADLHAKRAQIDQAIAAIEGLRSGAPATQKSATPNTNHGAANNGVDGPGALLGMSIADATKKLLASKRTTLKNPELATLFRAGGLVLNSKDWVNTVGAVLTRRADTIGDIVKVERGTWGLKEWYPNRSFKKEKEPAKPDSPTGDVLGGDFLKKKASASESPSVPNPFAPQK